MRYTAQDVITPANAITMLGLVLVLVGCFQLNTWQGLGFVVLGRFMDLLDGPVARATKSTKFSVYLDPTVDKIALLAIVIASLHFHLVPLMVIIYIILQNSVVAAMSILSDRQGTAVGALISGKLNLFFQNIAIFSFAIAALSTTLLSGLFITIAWVSLLASLPFAVVATLAYRKQLRRL